MPIKDLQKSVYVRKVLTGNKKGGLITRRGGRDGGKCLSGYIRWYMVVNVKRIEQIKKICVLKGHQSPPRRHHCTIGVRRDSMVVNAKSIHRARTLSSMRTSQKDKSQDKPKDKSWNPTHHRICLSHPPLHATTMLTNRITM